MFTSSTYQTNTKKTPRGSILSSDSNNPFLFHSLPPYSQILSSRVRLSPPPPHSLNLTAASTTRSQRHDPMYVYIWTGTDFIPLWGEMSDEIWIVYWIKVSRGMMLVLLVGLKLLTRVKVGTASPGCHGDAEYGTWARCSTLHVFI